MQHLLTFDIEHWYESWRQRDLPYDQQLPDCDSACIFRLLDLLDAKDQKATFFFTGNFAEEFPHVAMECVKRGHEVASHSSDHTLLEKFKDAKAFRRNLQHSLKQIEQACGVRPIGFRAPKWSLSPKNVSTFLPEMIAAGLKYDSSIFPGHFPNFSENACIIKTVAGEIIEIPARALHIGPFTAPIGGAWFRLFPQALTSIFFAQCEKVTKPGLFYAHPYDLNPKSHCPVGTPLKLQLIRRLNVKGAWKKLENLLGQYKFTSIHTWLQTAKISDRFHI